MTGRLSQILFDRQVEQNTSYQFEIDGSSLRPGVYYCMLTQSDGNFKVVKLIYKE
jgi:hypothetical protein